MNRLLKIGFQLAGHWLLVDDCLTLQFVRHASQTNVLYAFCCDGDIKYVGKTTQSLATRLYGYRKPGPSQSTNQRNHRLIRENLAAGVAVDIFALPDNGLMHYGDFHVNLSAGLEDSIISMLKPEWNGSRTAQVESSNIQIPDTSLADFGFTLHKTYFQSGFFNVSVDYQSVFAGDGEQIDIFCGDSKRPTNNLPARAKAPGFSILPSQLFVSLLFEVLCVDCKIQRVQSEQLSRTIAYLRGRKYGYGMSRLWNGSYEKRTCFRAMSASRLWG